MLKRLNMKYVKKRWRRKNLTTDNLRRRRIIVLDLCCLCKRNGESISQSYGILSSAYLVFSGLCLKGYWVFWLVGGLDVGSPRIKKLWNSIPHCFFWCLWWERNSRCFEGKERHILELKWMLLHILMEWTNASGLLSSYTIFDFLDYCTAWFFWVVSSVHILFTG